MPRHSNKTPLRRSDTMLTCLEEYSLIMPSRPAFQPAPAPQMVLVFLVLFFAALLRSMGRSMMPRRGQSFRNL